MTLARAVVMVEPRDFGFNQDTAVDNAFQHHPDGDEQHTRTQAMREFWAMVERLDDKGLEIIVLKSPPDVHTPDAVFPNNWFSTTAEDLIIYPMFAESRRLEIQLENLSNQLLDKQFVIQNTHELNIQNDLGGVLEGTGVLIFDHLSRDVYANLSERCSEVAFQTFCERFDFNGFKMRAMTDGLVPIYHTNVMMALGFKFAVIADSCLTPDAYNSRAMQQLHDSRSDIIHITEEQMVESFCGNILQLASSKGHPLIVMSESARQGFSSEQMKQLEKHGEIVACDINTIEYVGGGSARCMLAEIFLQKH